MRLEYIWLAVGVIFILLGLSDFFSYGSWRPLLTVAIGGLITYSSVRNLGGWATVKYDIKRRLFR